MTIRARVGRASAHKVTTKETEDMGQNSLQDLRDDFRNGEEVHVEIRGYAGRAARIELGTIVAKEAAFARIKFEDGVTRKYPYKQLRKCPKKQIVKRSGVAPTAPAAPVAPPVLRAVPPALAQIAKAAATPPLVTPAPKPADISASSPAPVTAPASVVAPANPVAQKPSVAKTGDTCIDNTLAWFEMSDGVLDELNKRRAALLKESEELAEQAQELLDESDAKKKAADETVDLIEAHKRFQSEWVERAKEVLEAKAS